MDITRDQTARHSENDFASRFLMLVDSGAGVIHVRTGEPLRAIACIRRTALLDNGVYNEWDIVNGNRIFTAENYNDEGVLGDGNVDISDAFQSPLGAMRDGNVMEAVRFFVFVNPHVFMENNPHMQQLLLMYSEYLPARRICVVLVTPDQPLPESAAGPSILTLSFVAPSLSELRERLEATLVNFSDSFPDGVDLDDDMADRVCFTGSGLSLLQFETYVSLAAVEAARDGETKLRPESVVASVQIGKTEVVNSSDILELYEPSNIEDVGGMENLKEWVRRRGLCYSDEAKESGVEAPKGIVLVGVPGSGKSLVARAIAGTLGIPLVRLDFGRVFSSYVGSSEKRIRAALKMIESMAPVVLFADEVDKGLGGISGGSGSDSGVGMRVLGSYLTWLQDCTYPVFNILTANNIDGLPPELLRRGRFDAIFSTSLPTPRERREVLAIHLRKRGRSIDSFSKQDIENILEASNRYVPSEIESAVKDALVDAFSEGEELTARHIVHALSTMVPLSKSYAAQIDRMIAWAEANATPVSSPDAPKPVLPGRRVRPVTRRQL